MKYILALALLISALDGITQASTSKSAVLIKANDYILPQQSLGAASKHALNWKTAAEASTSDASAWFNYYLWTERDKQLQAGEKKKKLATIINDAGRYIKNNAHYHLMLFLQSGRKDSASIHKVMTAVGDKFNTYPYIIQFLNDKGIDSSLNRYCREWETINPMRKDLYQYHYNALMSAEKNAVVYAKGVNDLVPMAVLQQVYGIRKDLELKTYDETVLLQDGAYLCISLGREVLAKYPQASYTGLLVKIGGDISGAELKDHFDNHFDLSQVNNMEQVSVEAAQLYKNYLPSFILLYENYKKNNNAKQVAVLSLIQQIAAKAGVAGEINKLIGN